MAETMPDDLPPEIVTDADFFPTNADEDESVSPELMSRIYPSRVPFRSRSMTDGSKHRIRWLRSKRKGVISAGVDLDVSEKFQPRLYSYSVINQDDHRFDSTGLAQHTSPISIRSLPSHLNRISELKDEHHSSSDLKAASDTVHYVKRSKSDKVKKKNKRYLPKPEPELTEAQRSRSLTHIECIEDDASDSFAKADKLSLSPVGLTTQRHLAVSMGDISKIEQNRGRLQKSIKVSSQECFRVSFDFNDEHVQEYLPAVQGRLLRDALHDLLDERGIDVNSIQIYQESSNTPFLPYCDTARLAGSQLRLKIKSSPANSFSDKINGIQDKPALTKKGSKYKKGGGGSNVSEDPPVVVHGHPDGTWKGKKIKALFPNPFNKSDNDKLDALAELLDRYNQRGLPELKGLVTFECAQDDELAYRLETHWSDIVENAEELPERVQQQQSALWELLQTEANYIQQLKVIIDRFKLCLCNLQTEMILTEIDLDRLFSNVQEISIVNRSFWNDHLRPMLEETRTTKKPLNPLLMTDGFLRFPTLFHPYTKYCLDRAACLQYIKDQKRSNEAFKAYIAWCETQKECNRQRFTDLCVKPMQRLTKYSLLLKAVLKNTDCEFSKQTISSMVNSVEMFVNNVNASLRQRHEQERLATIISRIDSYDVVEAKDDEVQRILKAHLSLDLTCPMPGCNVDQTRQLLLEGDLKLKDAYKNGMDVHCFLFTDMLLVCKPVTKKGDKVKVVRQPYVIDRLVVYEMKERGALLMVYLNEYLVSTTVFCLSGGDIRHWHECIKKAQELYMDAKLCVKQPTNLGYLTTEDADGEFDYPSHALLTARSPRSSQSSLVHSHSGSMDMSEPIPCGGSHGRAVSLEFAEMRASSASSDEGSTADQRVRPQEIRSQQQPTSPRPERRKYFFKSNSGSNSPNTLSVSYPYNDSHESSVELSPTSLLVPYPKIISPTSRTSSQPPPISPRLLKRNQPAKPPLVKTKNIPCTETRSPALDMQCFDFDVAVPVPVITTATTNSSPESDEDGARSKLNQKRTLRTDRRYHTADSIENMKRDKDPSIHKRLSLNYPPGTANERVMKNKQVEEKCLSCESMYSSSGVSSTGSLHQSTDCELLSETTEEAEDTYEPFVPLQVASSPPAGVPAMQLDVSEIKDGISSVQIKVQENSVRHVKRDYQKMKEFILNDKLLEASEV